jgi:cell division protease FtsH
MVTSFGMSEKLGPVTIGEQSGEVFLGASLQELGQVGPATLELIDREVESFVIRAEDHATNIVHQNWASVTEVAEALLEHETLAGVALDALLSTVHPVGEFDPRADAPEARAGDLQTDGQEDAGALPHGDTR